MTRLTRAESQAQTRTQLVATAKELFLEDGYLATSLEKVADAAGFSKGAVYSNFRNKDELCTAVLDEIRAEKVAEIMAIIAESDQETLLRQLQQWAERVIGDPRWTPLELEFTVQARRNDDIRADLATRLQGTLALLDMAYEQSGVDSPIASRDAVVGVLALGVGLGFFRSIDPTIPVTGLVEFMRLLTNGPGA